MSGSHFHETPNGGHTLVVQLGGTIMKDTRVFITKEIPIAGRISSGHIVLKDGDTSFLQPKTIWNAQEVRFVAQVVSRPFCNNKIYEVTTSDSKYTVIVL